jgi:large subunit ribosomal protein L28
MKKSIVTMKPNVKSRRLRSDILNMSFKLEITTKARKCIMKAGSLDNYLLTTNPRDIDSKFGMYLRSLLKRKKVDPNFAVPYIKGTAKLPRSRKTSVWEYKQIPAMYMPANVRVSEDHSKYFFKTPQEMSRFEIADLERMLREIDEPDEFVPDEELWATPEFQDLRQQMIQIQPIRHGIIKKYFEKFKWQKKKRDLLLEILKESEEQVSEVLSPTGEFVPYKEAIPEIKQFMAEVEAREKIMQAKREAEAVATGGFIGEGDSLKKDKEAKIEEVIFDPEIFNPFDKSATKRE